MSDEKNTFEAKVREIELKYDNPEIKSKALELHQELQNLRARFGCIVFCKVLLGVTYWQILAGVEAAKKAGAIRDEAHCKQLGSSAAQMADALRPHLPPGVPEVIAAIGELGCFDCVCEDIF